MARAGESQFFQGKAAAVVCGRVPGFGAPHEALRGLLGSYLAALGLEGASLTLSLVSGAQSRGLNRRFRGKDKATDVLSFPASEGLKKPGFSGYLGDLALCPAYAWRRRGRFFPEFGAEAAFLVGHGLLHLSGRHHDSPAQERAMWRMSLRLQPHSRPWSAALARLGPLKRKPKP
ncbi:MAG TPA: rRNA maturation RNase YbeY [bacterium]|jgi:rRNA maturation RNase YbeY|nr:rRNA maturation RNase YbeY [bacterium]